MDNSTSPITLFIDSVDVGNLPVFLTNERGADQNANDAMKSFIAYVFKQTGIGDVTSVDFAPTGVTHNGNPCFSARVCFSHYCYTPDATRFWRDLVDETTRTNLYYCGKSSWICRPRNQGETVHILEESLKHLTGTVRHLEQTLSERDRQIRILEQQVAACHPDDGHDPLLDEALEPFLDNAPLLDETPAPI